MVSSGDEAWNKIFQDLDLLQNIESEGFFRISASQMKVLGGREPRLLAKQDTLRSRPKIFRKNNLSILPIRNGEYVVYRDNLAKTYFRYSDGFDKIPIEVFDPSPDVETLESLNINSLSSEFQAIDYANIASIIHSFTKEDQLNLTIRGRLRSGIFSFYLLGPDEEIIVDGVQIEVDSGFESKKAIYLIEAKIGKRDDFNIRQLYYPWKEWSKKTTKQVIPIFFVYSNGIFYLTKFRFGEVFGDIEIIESRSYLVNEEPMLSVNLEELLKSECVDDSEENDVPFPQANDLDKVIDIITSFRDEVISKDQISDLFEFDERQGDYYANAAVYLNLLKRNPEDSGSFILTGIGKEMRRCSNRRCRNNLMLIQLIKKSTFRSLITMFRNQRINPNTISKDEISDIIQKENPEYSSETCLRRASTVKSWMKWVLKNVQFESEWW